MFFIFDTLYPQLSSYYIRHCMMHATQALS